jgi:hypothetical protein
LRAPCGGRRRVLAFITELDVAGTSSPPSASPPPSRDLRARPRSAESRRLAGPSQVLASSPPALAGDGTLKVELDFCGVRSATTLKLEAGVLRERAVKKSGKRHEECFVRPEQEDQP